MKPNIAATILIGIPLHSKTYAQQYKPANAGNVQAEKKKIDSLNLLKSKNEVSIETTERKRNNSDSGVRLDDLKNPFDTSKVKTAATINSNKQQVPQRKQR